MVRQIFINLPVADLPKSISFFSSLGFTFNAQWTDETGTCMNIGENIFAMLLTRERFQSFTPKPVADAHHCSEVLTCLALSSREAVDTMVKQAIGAGGQTYSEPQDHGFMYGHGFQDPDGHIWELCFFAATLPPKAE